MPEWVEPTARYMLEEGLVLTLKVAVALVGSTIIGVTLGTLLTIRFRPMQWLIRLYIEVWRGLPILITIFLIFFALPALGVSFTVAGITFDGRFLAWVAATIGLILWVAPRSRRPRAAPCSRSRASSTKLPRRSASAGPDAMRS